MPDLQTRLHVDMLHWFHRRRNVFFRIVRAIKRELSYGGIYGLEWGDPEVAAHLKFIRDRYVTPYINPGHIALEIGPGGGRWTRYLLSFKTLYVVDYYDELLAELKRNFKNSNMVFIKNNGTDFPGIPEESIDYLFSFGAFVHLDLPIIETYLRNMKSILKPGANVVIHYSDKTKIIAQLNDGFSENTPAAMRRMVLDAGYTICEEDLTSTCDSSLIRFTL